MSRHRTSTKKAPPEIGLHMECVEEELEPSQIAYYKNAEKEYNEVQNKLDNYIKKMKAEVVEKGENCFVLQLNATPPPVAIAPAPQISTSTPKTTRQSVQATQSYQQMVGQGIITRSTANAAGNTYLVMDPRLGFMVGQMQSPNITSEQSAASSTPKPTSAGRGRPPSTPSSVMVTTRAKSSLKKQGASTSEPEVLTPPLTRTREKAKQAASPQTSPPVVQQQQVFSTAGASTSSGSYKIKMNAKPLPAPAKPGESNALGGLSAGSKTPWKPNNEETSKCNPDSREILLNKAAGKTFPSLVVIARPHLKVKYIPQASIAQERTALDAKVKGVLMYTPTKFIEWLIQQGLIRSDQMCQIHVNNDLSPVKLKFGMYSDVSKFPYSGGYVWISDCCPSQFVSVFSGSIFEGAPHPPTTLLKLIYHWACQTNVQNVVQWVKVDNLYLKNFYINMRAVCTQAVHEKYKKLGGPRKKIEVGVISLGTTSQDGNRRQVKVEVLGVMDQENKLIRLRAIEPLSDERSFKRRFVKILEPLEEWVNKESTILTDFTVAKTALSTMGFHSVVQGTSGSKYSNQNIMEYLRRIVPRMFQNTLSLLSRQIIQQFLDELVWREMWGPIPSQAFTNIVSHIAEQTKMDVSENFLVRLNKVAGNPFKRWDYSVWKPVTGTRITAKTPQKASSASKESLLEISSKAESAEPATSVKGVRTRKRAAEQSSSESSVTSSPISAKKIPKVSIKEKLKKEEKPSKKEKEPSDKLPEDIVKFINEGKQISLEKYYYGSRNGSEDLDSVYRGRFNVKCCVCNKRFTENIVLMKHMILHCQTEPLLVIDLKKVHQCEYCFLGFNTTGPLKNHLEEVHSVVDDKIDSNLLCFICEEKFRNRLDLVYHMHRTHVQLELPYECGVCRFRTSAYKTFVDHFIKVHKGEEHVFCPYCLKVVTFSYKGEVITLNVLFYMSHLEKHQRLNLVKDCSRCQLSFIHKGILDQHMDADHGSWSGKNDVEPLAGIPGGISMPEPGSLIKPAPPLRAHKSPRAKIRSFASNRFKTLELYGVDEDMACLECEGSLTKTEHFTASFNCLKCQYATCCEKAMVEHLDIFHETPYPQFTQGKPIVLPQEMFCICGYSSSSGNRIAKHLALCEKKSAYSSKETAATAVQSAPKKDKKEDKIKQGEGQNVLNMLGLVRKSPEVAVTGNESMKMEVDQEEVSIESDVKLEKEDTEVIDSLPEGEPPEGEPTPDNSETASISEPTVIPKNEETENQPEGEKPEDAKPQTETSEEPSTDAVSVELEEEEKATETPMEVTEEVEEKDEAAAAEEPEERKGEMEVEFTEDEVSTSGEVQEEKNEAAEPETMIEGAEPDSMIDAAEPDSMIDAAQPDSINNAVEPDSMNEATEPESMIDATKPESMIEVTKPESMIEVTKPESMIEVTKPESMIEAAEPDSMIETADPDSMNNAAELDSMNNAAEPKSMIEAAEPDSMIEEPEKKSEETKIEVEHEVEDKNEEADAAETNEESIKEVLEEPPKEKEVNEPVKDSEAQESVVQDEENSDKASKTDDVTAEGEVEATKTD